MSRLFYIHSIQQKTISTSVNFRHSVLLFQLYFSTTMTTYFICNVLLSHSFPYITETITLLNWLVFALNYIYLNSPRLWMTSLLPVHLPFFCPMSKPLWDSISLRTFNNIWYTRYILCTCFTNVPRQVCELELATVGSNFCGNRKCL